MKTALLTSLTLLMLSMPLFSQELKVPLVNITGKLNPKLDLKGITEEEMKKVAKGLDEISDIGPIDIDISDIFVDEDKRALELASNHIAEKFLGVVKSLINIRSQIYKIALNEQVFSDNDKKVLRESHKMDLAFTYNEMIGTLLIVHDQMEAAITACSSKTCVGALSSAEREIINFGKSINQGIDVQNLGDLKVDFLFKEKLNKALISQSYESIKTSEQKGPYEKMVQSTYASLVNVTQDKELLGPAMKNTMTKGISFDLPKIKIPPMSTNIANRSMKELDKLVKNKLLNKKRGKKFKKDREIIWADVLMCSPTYDHEAMIFVALVPSIVGGNDDGILTCLSAKTGRVVDITISGIGVGLEYATGLNFLISFEGPVNIHKDNYFNFIGLNVSATAILGAQTGFFIGGNGAMAQILGVQLGGGAHVAIERFKFNYRP